MRNPFLSVIIPAHNAKETILACIDSVLSQDYPPGLYEVIVVDNNSTDGTDEVARQAGVKVVYEREMQTSYAARNRGLQAAKGEIVVFTDSDCTAAPDWLRMMASRFSDPEIAAVAGGVENGPASSMVEHVSDELNIFHHFEETGSVSLITANAAIRKDVLCDLGSFDETLFTAGDVDMGWRIQLIGGQKVVFNPEARVTHHHRTSVSGLYRQYRRYGYSEILLTTLFKHRKIAGFIPSAQVRRIFKQVGALVIYLLSFLKKGLFRLFRKTDDYDLWRPLILFVAEFGSITGKLKALVETRGMQRNPFPSRPEIHR